MKDFRHEGIADRPLLLFGFLLVSAGIQLLCFGLMAEMQARTYHESQDKPIYIIKEVREFHEAHANQVRESHEPHAKEVPHAKSVRESEPPRAKEKRGA